MRLRQLRTTQSIMFAAPPEVHQSILDTCEIGSNTAINSSHVIHWLLEQTCRGHETLQGLYIAQGEDYCRRTNSRWKYGDFHTNSRTRKTFIPTIIRNETLSLEELYGNAGASARDVTSEMSFPILRNFGQQLIKKRQDLKSECHSAPASVLEHVEQEREVEFEVEEVRQVQKPVHFKALKFPGLHHTILHFATTGLLLEKGYIHAFEVISRTTIGQKHKIGRTSSRLYVSDEFLRTVEQGQNRPNDNFLVSSIVW